MHGKISSDGLHINVTQHCSKLLLLVLLIGNLIIVSVELQLGSFGQLLFSKYFSQSSSIGINGVVVSIIFSGPGVVAAAVVVVTATTPGPCVVLFIVILFEPGAAVVVAAADADERGELF